MIQDLEHLYGPQVHLINDKLLNSLLTSLCQPQTIQPTINELVEFLYTSLTKTILNREFPAKKVSVETRMTQKHPNQRLTTEVLDRDQKVVSVNLARAGTFPSHICYNLLNYVLNPQVVRQDHVTAARQTDEKHRVIGTSLAGSKIGGDIDDAIVIFPDPMGATGGTIVSAMDFYKKNVKGRAKKFIAVHLIITPEYLRQMLKAHPEVVIYAVRVDRGLSSPDVLKEIPGKRWDEEKGLDDTHYIVPGGGGFGEILNNSYV